MKIFGIGTDIVNIKRMERSLKKHGFKFDRSSKKWRVYNILDQKAEEFASYCREFGLNFDRSDRNIKNFDYVDYLWEGRRNEFMDVPEEKILPKPISQKK